MSEQVNKNPLTDENYVRDVSKNWLLSFKVVAWINVAFIAGILGFIFYTFFSAELTLKEVWEEAFETEYTSRGQTILFALFSVILLLYSLSWYLCYHFFYKKQGTKLLAFTILLATFRLVKDVYLLFVSEIPVYGWGEMGFSLLLLALAAYYYINCVRLYRVNRALKKERKALAA